MIQAVLFYGFSALAVLTALFVIFLPQPTRALLSLVVTMFSLAVLYLLLGAYFVSMVHLIVYAGAVLVLFLFVIMLQGIGAKEVPFFQRFHPFYLGLAGLLSIAFITLLGIFWTRWIFEAPVGIQGTIETFGMALFNEYLLPFELISVLLLLGVFAAIALAKKDDAS